MDYTPINIRFAAGEKQGDYAMEGIGPYDVWAIEYGYTHDAKELPKLLERSSASRSTPTAPTKTPAAPTRSPAGTTSAPTR